MAKVEIVTKDASSSDFERFGEGEEQRISDLATFMAGTSVSQGGQYDMNPRGLTNYNGEFQQPQDTTGVVPMMQQPAPYAPSNQPPFPGGGAPAYSQPAPQPEAQPEEGEWKKRYGQSENEKGELRRALQQQMEQNAQLNAQLSQMSQPIYPPQPTYNYAPPQAAAPYSYVPPTIYPAAIQAPVDQRFISKGDEEMLLAGDLEGVLRDKVTPAVYNTWLEAKQAQERAARVEHLYLTMEKERRGITQQVEQQALVEQPWIRNLQTNPDPTVYLGALSSFVATKKAQEVMQRTSAQTVPIPPPPPATRPATPEAAIRRYTYVEGGGSGSDEGQTQAKSYEREMAEAMIEPNLSKRAVKMREVFARYGVGSANDWRDPSVATR